ncbi:hypothetical protein NL676_008641 [Syzygium grande]|nr:hypothetical protein NL676_008641 [Syzygium grande]
MLLMAGISSETLLSSPFLATFSGFSAGRYRAGLMVWTGHETCSSPRGADAPLGCFALIGDLGSLSATLLLFPFWC